MSQVWLGLLAFITHLLCAVLGSNPGPEGMGKGKKEENTPQFCVCVSALSPPNISGVPGECMMCLKCYLLLSVRVSGVCMWTYCHGAHEGAEDRQPGYMGPQDWPLLARFAWLQLSAAFLGLNSLKAGVEVCLFACLFPGRILLCSPG